MILFCADGNPEIGGGHIMRCVALAAEAKNRGSDCIFITASSDFSTLIEQYGHKCICTYSDYRKADAETVCRLITEYKPQTVVADSYFMDADFLDKVLHCTHDNDGKLLYIDDLAAFSYPCDFLLNYNIYGIEMREKYDTLYSVAQKPKMLLGTKYAPLREEFRHLQRREISTKAKDILLSTGGADSEHIALSVAENASNYPALSFHILVGSMNADRNRIREVSDLQRNVTVYENVDDICGLMQSLDVAVSAAGSTLYELCATQTPTITYVVADNQISGAKSFEQQGVMNYAGDIRDTDRTVFIEKLMSSAAEMCKNHRQREDMAVKMAKAVDGYGCIRIVDAILENN